mgnify:CR=1 FL=1
MKFNVKKEDLLFVPLGGAGEIGMNVNLYRYKGKWLMFDLGAGFADDTLPGIDMMAPDLTFVYENKKDFLGIVLTHAHEDHIGSVTYLWGQLGCPIYATPFTAAVIKAKLEGEGITPPGKLNIIDVNSDIEIGPFKVELVQITHSIPEMSGAIIKTEYGNIMHTGDWKIDPDPVIGPTTDEQRLIDYGKEGVLCMVCDSTNVLNEGHSGSEGDLLPSLKKLISEQNGLVAVTTFASNVARIDTIVRAAEANGRQVALLGRSLGRIVGAAKECGYLSDVNFVNERHVHKVPRNKMLLICTGCQGEPHAAMNKLVNNEHQTVRLIPGDTVIFSSKIIPGNEKKIFRMYNKLLHTGMEVITEKDHFVHVSGHPCREELRHMYKMLKPEIAIPVHGEALHIHEHIKLAKEMGVPKQVEVENGSLVRIAPGRPEVLGKVQSGYLGVDGFLLVPSEGNVIKMRRRIMIDGLAFVVLVMNKKGKLEATPVISTPGLLDEQENKFFIEDIALDIEKKIESTRHVSEEKIATMVTKTVRSYLKREIGKYPFVKVQIVRV